VHDTDGIVKGEFGHALEHRTAMFQFNQLEFERGGDRWRRKPALEYALHEFQAAKVLHLIERRHAVGQCVAAFLRRVLVGHNFGYASSKSAGRIVILLKMVKLDAKLSPHPNPLPASGEREHPPLTRGIPARSGHDCTSR
jgi:hypothetical protein